MLNKWNVGCLKQKNNTIKMKSIIYYTNEGTVSTKPSVWAESDYKALVENQKTLAEKFQTMDGFTVEFFEGPVGSAAYDGSVCVRKCYLNVADNGKYFIKNQIQLMND